MISATGEDSLMRLVHGRMSGAGLARAVASVQRLEASGQKSEVRDQKVGGPVPCPHSDREGRSAINGQRSAFRLPPIATSRRGTSAFTLLEILLAIGLMALLAGALVAGAIQLVGDKPATPVDVFWQAVLQSRQAALESEHEVRLSFDSKEKTFVLSDGATTKSLPVPASKDLTVDFLSAQAGGSTILIGGELVDTQTMPFVTFYPDGTCSAFRIQFRAGGAARILAIDPWTCAQVLAKGDNPT
jgi:Tfp pilus assembly protein FimT